MRMILLVSSLALVSVAPVEPRNSSDPELLLRERYNLSVDEIAKARAGQPVAKLLKAAGRDELAIVGTVRIAGDQKRLADWIRNIEHFRGAAELGVARVIPSPPSAAAFADPALDAGQQALLAGYVDAYLKGGNDGVSAHEGNRGARSLTTDIRTLLAGATVLPSVAPELAQYLDRYPAATLPDADQCLYWSALPADTGSVVTLHHLVVLRRPAGETLIADKTIYASRYFDAGIMAMALYGDAAGQGFYVIAGSRIKSSELERGMAVVLRRQVERSALDLLRMYLGWMRDSLAQG